ncbi:hypothetical protein CRUP_028920 [Coryphaenoides rupestris]|nr:hypothetical protein CRUP_028920 [Coryphaenoides rupestris]
MPLSGSIISRRSQMGPAFSNSGTSSSSNRSQRLLLPLLPKTILVELQVVRLVTIATRVVQRLLGDGLRAPVLTVGLPPLGLWLAGAVSLALPAHISSSPPPVSTTTTYPSAPSRLDSSSRSPRSSAGTASSSAAASSALGKPGPAPGSAAAAGAPAAPGGRASPGAPPPAAPPATAGRLEVIVAVVGVLVAAAVVIAPVQLLQSLQTAGDQSHDSRGKRPTVGTHGSHWAVRPRRLSSSSSVTPLDRFLTKQHLHLGGGGRATGRVTQL